MGNKVTTPANNESEEEKDLKIYSYALRLQKVLPLDLSNNRITQESYNEKMSKIQNFINYYETTYTNPVVDI
jgi:hypothetical protein